MINGKFAGLHAWISQFSKSTYFSKANTNSLITKIGLSLLTINFYTFQVVRNHRYQHTFRNPAIINAHVPVLNTHDLLTKLLREIDTLLASFVLWH
jgi:hypothetical protein